MFRSLKSVLFLFAAALLAPQFLIASCGSASCPIDTHSSAEIEKGYVRFDYSYEYIDQSRAQVGRHSASVGQIRGHHDEQFTINQTQRIGFDAGLTNRLSLFASLPFVHREHQHVHHHHGTDITDSWNFTGMGDLTLLARYAIVREGQRMPRLAIIAGGILPTGRDRVVNADGAEAEAGILPGKSAYSVILGGSVSKNLSAKTASGVYAKMPLFFSSTYQWNDEGIDHYKIGNSLQANVGTVYPVFPRLGFMLQSNLRIARRDGKGNTGEEVQKTGGTFVYVSPGLQFGMTESLWSYFLVQVPVYQRVNGIQLVSDYNFLGGLSYRFSVL